MVNKVVFFFSFFFPLYDAYDVTFPLCCKNWVGGGFFFCSFTVRIWWGSWRQNPQQYESSPETTPECSHPCVSPHSVPSNSWKVPFQCSHQFMALAAFTLGKRIMAGTASVHLVQQSRFHCDAWPCNFDYFLMDPRKAITFQLVALFFLF